MSEYGEALAPGARIAEFEVVRELGEGGFGITYLARDLQLHRSVAVKEYLPLDWGTRRVDGTIGPRSRSVAEDYAWGLERFLGEARTLARLNHPQIVRVYRVIPARGTAYLIMEYVEGRSLKDELRLVGKFDEARVRSTLDGLTAGLIEVHSAGLLHRDIKPANVMLRARDGSPVLIDFGSARQQVGERSRSMTAVLTPGYAPIEQYSSRGNQGPWTDIYALGAVAYRALSGRTPEEAIDRIRGDKMPRIEEVVPDVSDELAAVVNAALEVNEGDRPHDVATWRGMLADREVVAQQVDDSQKSGESQADRETESRTGDLSGVQLGDRLRRAHKGSLERSDAGIRDRAGRRQWFLGAAALVAAVIVGILGLRTLGDGEPQEQLLDSELEARQIADAREDSIQLAREDSIQLAREDSIRLARATQLVRDDSIRLAREDSMRLVREDSIRLARSMQLAGEDSIRLAREDSIQLAREDSIRLARQDSIRRAQAAREDSIRLARQDSIRRAQAAREDSIRLAEAAREDSIRLARQAREESITRPRRVFRDCGICPQMVVVPAGTFVMGSPEWEVGRDNDESPQHTVTIGAPFAVGVYEVTFAEWDSCVEAGGCSSRAADDVGYGRGRRPVISVSWDHAQEYVTWLRRETGKPYRLLSEAEWEYVARAGTETARYWGTSESEQCRHANGYDRDGHAEFALGRESVQCSDGSRSTAEVGSYSENGFGIHDVLGNTWEWTQDCWHPSYSGAPGDGSAWETGECSTRVLRGGSWSDRPRALRSASRYRFSGGIRLSSWAGFRVAQSFE